MARFLWTQRQDTGPSPRMMHAVAYDEARKQTVLFGGYGAPGVLSETWGWDGSYWTQLADIGPASRYASAMAFDSRREETLLFGGLALFGATPFASNAGDSWTWDGADWTQVEDTGPSARWGHGIAYDPERDRTVLFGGYAGGMKSDTWEWDGSSWTQVEETGPPARFRHSLGFDRSGGRVVMHGGASVAGTVNDTWTWDGVRWKEIADIGPPPRMSTAIASTDLRSILFGGTRSGSSSPSEILADSWTLDGNRWTQRQDIGPGARFGHSLSFDEARRVVTLFGGIGSPIGFTPTYFGDTWEYREQAA